jgi:hypothetical protein
VPKMVRVNTRISAELNRWLNEESQRTGVSKSTLIHLALTIYIQQRRAIGSLEEIIKRLDRIEKQAKAKGVAAEPTGSVAADP